MWRSPTTRPGLSIDGKKKKKIIDLDDVKRVVSAAEAEARKNNWNVVIAVVDDGGHLMYLQREKVQLGSIDVAITKAKVALMFRRPTRFWEDLITNIDLYRQGYRATGSIANGSGSEMTGSSNRQKGSVMPKRI